MVGEHRYGHRFFPRLHLVVYRLYDTVVEVLYGPNLKVEVAIMSCLVSCLKVQEHEVLVVKLCQRSLHLTLIVGVGKSRGTRHLDNIEPSIMSNASDEVNGRDDTAGGICGKRSFSVSIDGR